MKISLIIPTKNRPKELLKILNSIALQTRIPDEVIVIDQTYGYGLSKEELLAITQRHVNVRYFHNSKIRGLVEAKNIGLGLASFEIIAFLDDDLELKNNYFEEISNGFSRCRAMYGCSGFFINKKRTFLINFLKNILNIGIFNDPRISIFGSKKINSNLIECPYISGGISAWKRFVFNFVPIDINNDMHYFEDIDFSLRAFKRLGKGLYINTTACVIDKPSILNRDSEGKSIYKKLIEGYKFYNKQDQKNFPSLLMFFLKYFFYAIYISINKKNIKPLGLYFMSLRLIITKKINIKPI